MLWFSRRKGWHVLYHVDRRCGGNSTWCQDKWISSHQGSASFRVSPINLLRCHNWSIWCPWCCLDPGNASHTDIFCNLCGKNTSKVQRVVTSPQESSWMYQLQIPKLLRYEALCFFSDLQQFLVTNICISSISGFAVHSEPYMKMKGRNIKLKWQLNGEFEDMTFNFLHDWASAPRMQECLSA